MKLSKLAVALLIFPSAFTAFASADEPALIPRDVLFGNPERASPEISPDGKYLAYLAPDDKNVLQVFVRSVGKQDDRKVTNDPQRGIRQYFWAYDSKHILYLQDTAGDENYHLHAIDITTADLADRDLTPHKGVRVQGIDLDHKFPGEVLLGMNLKNKSKFDMYRLDLKTGEYKLDTENPGTVLSWVTDPDFKVRAATASTPDGGFDLLVREAPGQEWKKIRHWTNEEQGEAVGFSADGKTLYLIGNHNANAQRLVALDLASDKETVMAEDAHYDVGGAFVHPTKRTIQAVAFNRDMVEWKILDESIADDFTALGKLHRGEFTVVSRDLADKTWLVTYRVDDGPTVTYVYDRESRKGEILFTNMPKLEKYKLARMTPISYKSRDGLTIHGYLTTPVGKEAKNLPTVLLVHGGPWGRDGWGFNPLPQWLANRGYAVLQVNFRGSAGYGKDFLNAGNREWAGKMHDDLLDAVDWLVKEGIADSKKIAIMGGSYGGYATLVGVAFTPDVFCCGVDIVGPSNLVSLLSTIPPYWAPLRAMFTKRVGNPATEEEFLKSRSPLYKANQIKVPLLIGQGKNDPRVKQAESDQIVEAMRKAGKEVVYVIYKDEGHGFARPENRMHFFAITEQFLAKHLGGRSEPVGEIAGHSGEIK
jgi:dipeptidyl aminopeptidase/acylaminoacyl peptidase